MKRGKHVLPRMLVRTSYVTKSKRYRDGILHNYSECGRFILCQFSSTGTEFQKIPLPAQLLVAMKYQPHSFACRRWRQAMRLLVAYTHCSLLLASHLGIASSPPVPVPPTKSSFGFSGSWARCRLSSMMKGTSFPCRIPPFPMWQVKRQRETVKDFKTVLMAPGSIAASCLCSLPLISILLFNCLPCGCLSPPPDPEGNISHNSLTMSRNWVRPSHYYRCPI